MEKYLEGLGKCGLFRGVAAEETAGALEALGARLLEAGRGQAVLREGEAARWIGVVLSGRVQIVREDYWGNRSIVGQAGAGELFGEAFALGGTEALPVGVWAVEESRLLLLEGRLLLAPWRGREEVRGRMVANLLAILADKNRLLHRKLEITARRTTREKLMAYLLLQAKERGSRSFSIPYDRQGLADYLEVDRSGLSAEIGKLRRAGVLECRKNRFVLLSGRPRPGET